MNLIKKIKRKIFMLVLNRKIKPYNAKATVIFEGKVDTIQITVKTDNGEQFTQLHMGEYNYNKYLIENIISQVEAKKVIDNN